jgi:hypothetical protein
MRLTTSDLPRFKSPQTFNVMNQVDKEGQCKKCGEFGEIDKGNFCLDDSCRRDRLVTALYCGKARKLKDGTIVWAVE